MKQIDDLITEIARKHLLIGTLEERHRDSLDCHDVHVVCVKDALLAAYRAGAEAARAPTAPPGAVLNALKEIRLALLHHRHWKPTMPGHLASVAEAAIAGAEAAGLLPDPAGIDVHALLAARRQIASIWDIEDVQSVRPGLTDDQAWEVLQQVERGHDATIGINWDVLKIHADSPTTMPRDRTKLRHPVAND